MSGKAFTPAWLEGAAAATSLLARGFDDMRARAAAVEAARARPVDRGLAEALTGATPAQAASRAALLDGAVCVVTGQQAGLFGGPLYSVYKAAAAIVAARALEAETGVRCVPVFWLQNEDHDHAEIDHCHALGAEGLVRAEVPGPDDRRSICARRLGSGVEGALEVMAEALGVRSESASVMALLRRCYTPDARPDEAFAALVHAWFGREGLLVFDPAHPSARAAAGPILRRSVEEAGAIAEVLTTRSEALDAAGFEVQVHVRAGAPLPFLHPEGFGGPRYRLVPGDGFELVGTAQRVTAAAAAAGALSTSALLRPLVQDLLLPTAAYVGGPGEIAYFAQLPPLYAYFERAMPLVVPRARFQIVDGTAARLLKQLGVALDDLDAGRDALLAQVARVGEGPTPEAVLTGLAEGVEGPLAALAARAQTLDPGLVKQVEKTRASVGHAFERLVARYQQALAQDDAVAQERVERMLAHLRPLDAPQERVLGWATFAARCPELIDRVMEAVEPFDGGLKTLWL